MRKIIHIDMDCFYAAIEIRDRPELAGKPVAVGGSSRRGVLTTASYEARKFGCRSAMPTYKALQLCPGLILMPTRFDVYRRESNAIRAVFGEFTDLVEPLSLDEAYLDVSHLRSSAAAVAAEIRYRIRERTGLSASAGMAPNKLLAKIASDWRKPDGQFEVLPCEVDAFMRPLSVGKLWGVGGKTQEKIEALGARTCGELQGFTRHELVARFGKFGGELYDQCRGLDDRPVRPHRARKSLGNERTFGENITSFQALLARLEQVLDDQEGDIRKNAAGRTVRKAFVKLKFADFTKTSVERVVDRFDRAVYPGLLREAWERRNDRGVRLLGVGVRFAPPAGGGEDGAAISQLEMFAGDGEGPGWSPPPASALPRRGELR
ncbi:DNA polymerase IV [soil metagenome]